MLRSRYPLGLGINDWNVGKLRYQHHISAARPAPSPVRFDGPDGALLDVDSLLLKQFDARMLPVYALLVMLIIQRPVWS